MTTETIDPIETASEEDVSIAITAMLTDLGMSREELQVQAVAGRFNSEAARRAWFLVSSLEQIA